MEELEQFLSNQSVITFSHFPAYVNSSLASVGGIVNFFVCMCVFFQPFFSA